MCDSPYAVTFPEALYKQIEAKAKAEGFKEVDAFVIKKMEEIVGKSETDLSSDDEEKVKARLKALGYMD